MFIPGVSSEASPSIYGTPSRPVLVSLLTCVVLSLFSCSTTHYRLSADKEVYAIVAEKGPSVPGAPETFDVAFAGEADLANLPVEPGRHEFLGPEADHEVGAYIFSLEDALRVGFRHSREFQNRKERFYLEALSLTLDRHQFAPNYSAGVGGSIGGDANGEVSTSGDARVGMDYLLKSGGRLSVDLLSTFMQFLSGDPRDTAASILSSSFTQPLLAGRGRRVAAESLTQAERDVLYELRDFTRFGKTFAVRIASDYYRILRERDAVRNNYRGLQSFRLNLDRERAFADEGLSTPAAVGRLEQAELSRETAWIGSVRRYRQSLDNFKIMLGLPTDAPLILDDRELERLIDDGIRHPKFTSDYAVELGLTRRLDLETTRDRVEDAERRIQVTASALKPGLDLVLTSSLDSKGGNRVFTPDFDATQWSAGLDLDLPLNRKAERNGYRSALIAYERSIRDLALLGDRITFEIRDAWRALEQAKRTYEINLVGLELNRRRVEEQDLRAELGLGNVLDQVDAQNDLTNAQNDLTGQLIAHTVARLELWRDMGTLSVHDDGQWEEGFDVSDN